MLFGFGFDLQAQQTRSEIYMLQSERQEVRIAYADGRIIIQNLPKNELLEIYNIMGVKIYSRRVNAGTNEYDVNLPKGLYIIKLGEITRKIAVK